MKRSLPLLLTVVLIMAAGTMADAQQRRNVDRPRRSPRSSLKKGDKAPEFKLYSLSKTGEPSKNPLTVKEIAAEKPVTLIFSSFT